MRLLRSWSWSFRAIYSEWMDIGRPWSHPMFSDQILWIKILALIIERESSPSGSNIWVILDKIDRFVAGSEVLTFTLYMSKSDSWFQFRSKTFVRSPICRKFELYLSGWCEDHLKPIFVEENSLNRGFSKFLGIIWRLLKRRHDHSGSRRHRSH